MSIQHNESLAVGNVEGLSVNTIDKSKSVEPKLKRRKLTKKQKKFADAYIDSGNGTKSALEAYDTTPATARSIASENLTKPNIIEYLADKSNDAASMIYNLSQHSKQDFIKLNASKDILDRAGYKPIERSQTVIMTVNVENRDKMLSVASKVIEEMSESEI